MKRFVKTIACSTAGLALLSACTHLDLGAGPSARAMLQPTQGNNTSGQVKFVSLADRVRISGEVRGLVPGKTHGFHIHEKGDCSSGDGMSTGGHFNPTGQAHGAHGQGAHHIGDLPSLVADAQGVARFTFETSTLTIGNGAPDVVGRGLIVHRDPDDFQTQPTGNSGPRIACAVITRN
ncbi:superoxide dismutase family protein [Limnohabitans sp. Jir72]|uniref:superoxide dismutase family protein n=1 Tax=Limnohabitans sp. Jir72 TaxID=1977909 RepID=UPI000D3C1223|nr:superoxide dismutase family protein [Limnohabitans sp. Jir72]PUE34265.1 superoxide dismutase [Limnohabitans sp. Jir72]